jgi:hypothetical protein
MWEYDKTQKLPKFEECDITILYKDNVKVFYSKVKTAIQDGYKEYKPYCFKNKNGYLYSFTGLRGDAKRLYQDISKGKEKRIKLVKAWTWEEQKKYISSADYVILATGYQTSKVIVKTSEGKEIILHAKVPGTQYDIDNNFRLKMKDGGSLCKVFGAGLAYPTRTNDGRIVPEVGKPNPRADSFSLYLNYVGNKILGNILPKSKITSKVYYTYTDKDLKKKRKEDVPARIKTEETNIPVKQVIEKRTTSHKNSRKIIKKDQVIDKTATVKNKIIIIKPKTPSKKSYPQKMRDQVYSCKKPESKKITNILSPSQMGNKASDYSKNKLKEKLHLKERGNSEAEKVPSSYYANDIVSKTVANMQNKSHTTKSHIKDPLKSLPTALDAIISPIKANSKVSIIDQRKYSRHNKHRALKQSYVSQQMGGPNPASGRLPSHQRVVAMESGGFVRANLRNVGAGVVNTKDKNNAGEANDKVSDNYQVPVKIFEMHGNIRSILRPEEMQGTTVYKTDEENHKPVNSALRRTASKKQRNKGKKNNIISPILTQNTAGQTQSPIITTHPYRLGFIY